jgi:ParB family chromosome partitioning protein
MNSTKTAPVSSLGLLGKSLKKATGEALEVSLDLVIESDDNPRTIFSDLDLEQLAESIRSVGIQTPLGVWRNEDGKYVINHGHRRYRAARLVGLNTVPIVIGTQQGVLEKLVDNIQHSKMTPLEIGKAIQRIKKEQGVSYADFAKKSGKSPQWATYHVALVDMPYAIQKIYDLGICTDEQALNMLIRGYKKHENEIVKWLDSVVVDKVEIVSQLMIREFLAKLTTAETSVKEPKSKSVDGSKLVSADEESKSLVKPANAVSVDYSDLSDELESVNEPNKPVNSSDFQLEKSETETGKGEVKNDHQYNDKSSGTGKKILLEHRFGEEEFKSFKRDLDVWLESRGEGITVKVI